MSNATHQLAEHHKLCDEDFAAAEDAARKLDWDACGRAFARFRQALEAHFGVEEDVLFPEFERRTGMSGGPTRMMRMEHMQMRGLLDQLDAAQSAHDPGSFSGVAETLLVMMQQHNMKEENILYPMCEQALAGDAEVAQRIARGLRLETA
jgi:hemerythrin-like domain-containing protein